MRARLKYHQGISQAYFDQWNDIAHLLNSNDKPERLFGALYQEYGYILAGYLCWKSDTLKAYGR